MVVAVVGSMTGERVEVAALPAVSVATWPMVSAAETRAWHSVDADNLVEATVIGWRMRDVGNDVSLPTRDGGCRDL